MKEGKPSKTAEGAAGVRAIESMKPEPERVCYDPLAKEFLSIPYRIIAKSPFLAKAVLWLLLERHVPGAAGEAVLRTRYIDDYLRECIGNGIQQLVILGAGYDSRAYRIDGLKGKVNVFEVDHPATQKAKTERLRRVFGSLPDHVVHVPIDFNRQKLDERLFQCGYCRDLKTLFVWEGVTPYLTAEAVDETLSFVLNNSGRDSSIVFNYVYQSVADGTCQLKAARNHRELAAKRGEVFTFGIPEGTIDEFLSKRGFYQVCNASPESLESTYFKGPNRNRKTLPYLPTVHATVKPRG